MKSTRIIFVMLFWLSLHSLSGLFAQEHQQRDTTQLLSVEDNKDAIWQRTLDGRSILFNDGYVGIGTTAPLYMLHVDGGMRASAINVNGQYSLPSTSGATNQYLRGDGSWAVPAGGNRDGDCFWLSAPIGYNIYYNLGNVGIGTSSGFINARLQVFGNMNVGNNPHTNTVIGTNAFVGGLNSIATGQNSLAYGDQVKATNTAAFAVGFQTEANGTFSVAMGRASIADNINSIALGYVARANGINSIAIGKHIDASAGNAYVLGSGLGLGANMLVNNNEYSLMIGFKSTVPTFFVSSSNGAGTTGKIGIGNVTAPQDKLHIKADATETATIRLEPTATSGAFRFAQIYLSTHSISAANTANMVFTTPATSRHFVFENGNMGIGVSNPSKKLVVSGDIDFSGNLYSNGQLYTGSNWMVSRDDIYRLSGKVGIGTSNPLAKLEISGTVSVGYNVMTPDGQNNLLVEGKMGIGTFAPTEKLEVLGKIKTNHLQIMEGRYPGYLLLSDAAGNAVWTNPESITNIGPWARQGSYVYVGSNQKVGIGTSQPLQALHVEGNMLLGNNGNIFGNRSSWQPLKIFSGSDENQAHIALYGNYSDAGSIKLYSKGASGQIEFHNATNKILALKADNSIVFGDPDNACAVFVNGELTANQVRVNTGFWWDKVFNPSYPLMPLAELGDFIAKNRHLPEIPNEAEVLDKGVELGEMNGLLLKKIEELTLYLLEQDRKINTLQTELQQLKNAGINN